MCDCNLFSIGDPLGTRSPSFGDLRNMCELLGIATHDGFEIPMMVLQPGRIR